MNCFLWVNQLCYMYFHMVNQLCYMYFHMVNQLCCFEYVKTIFKESVHACREQKESHRMKSHV